MNRNVLITGQIPSIAVKILSEGGCAVTVNETVPTPSQKQLIKMLQKESYDAVITFLTDTIDTKIYDAAPTVKLYVNYASGFDNIDIASAKERSITIANSPALQTSEAVAEHTIALMLGLTARIVEGDTYVRQGKYKGWMPMEFIGMDIKNKKIGLVGCGRIGQKVAQYAHALGMHVSYYDIARNADLEKECGAVYFDSVDDLLRDADVVSLHTPLNQKTKHLINEANLRLMKPTSIIINTARGGVIDEQALERALADKSIAGAGLDVFEYEPKITKGLLKMKNVILTPHIASASIEARTEMAEIAAHNVLDFFEGRTPRNIVHI
jgi:glyoxylate reductase